MLSQYVYSKSAIHLVDYLQLKKAECVVCVCVCVKKQIQIANSYL